MGIALQGLTYKNWGFIKRDDTVHLQGIINDPNDPIQDGVE